jgi:hypothetical protein
MPTAAHQAGLEALLRHPSLWRGRNAAPPATFPTGHAALDAALPGGGWPASGLVETLIPGEGSGELRLWSPLVARLARQSEAARWCVFVAPPFEPYLPAWVSCGARAERLLVARGEPLWTLEQCLLSGACAIVFGWVEQATMRELRRLALAAEKGAALGVLVRPLALARAHSAAVLRLALAGSEAGTTVQLLKGRGLTPATVTL